MWTSVSPCRPAHGGARQQARGPDGSVTRAAGRPGGVQLADLDVVRIRAIRPVIVETPRAPVVSATDVEAHLHVHEGHGHLGVAAQVGFESNI
jgi:hypothetical protein